MLSIFGGKITTYRKLAEHAMAELARFFPEARGAWTAGAVLPGGDLPEGDFDRFVAAQQRARPGMPADLLRRLARAYGTRIDAVLGNAMTPFDLGTDLGGGLTLREVNYLCAQEWARSAEDILYRRSKLGLHAPDGTAARLAEYLAQEPRRQLRSA
jgi:glycerol-3-phosphate dehydrogenase